MATYAQQSQTRRMTVLATIIGLHLLLVWALATGLARKVVEVMAAPLQTDLIEELQKDDKPPPPPPPEMERPPVEVPPPDIAIDLPMETAQTTAITNVTDKPVPVAPPPPPASVRVSPKLDQRRSPPTDDFYPASARRAEIEGVTTVKACVSPDGKTTGEPSVGKSSGNSSLDEAAVRWAKRARWTPGTEDGKPIEVCAAFNVRFKLTE